MTDKTAGALVAADTKSIKDYIMGNIRDYGMLLSLLVIIVFFQYMTGGIMLAPQNVNNIVMQNGYVIVMALGMLLVIVAGYIDLSVGSVCALAGAIAGVLMQRLQWDWVSASLITLVIGAVIGGSQGYFIAYLRIPSFIVTLAGMLIFRGLTWKVLGSTNAGPFAESFDKISSGWIPDPWGGANFWPLTLAIGIGLAIIGVVLQIKGRMERQKHGVEEEPIAVFIGRAVLMFAAASYVSYLLSHWRGIPNMLVIMALLILVYGFVTTRTVIGRRIYALGGNEKAAKLSGVKTERLAFFTFVNMGVLAALAGLIVTARFGYATPKAGDGYELDVIAACFIGGASASGGVGKVAGAVIGALLMGVMNIGMSILGLGIDDQKMIKGIVLLFAVCLDVYYKKKG